MSSEKIRIFAAISYVILACASVITNLLLLAVFIKVQENLKIILFAQRYIQWGEGIEFFQIL
jgi:hypothetical protein